MFAWTLKEGVVLPCGNPAAYTNKRQEQPRDRVLSDDELKLVWQAIDSDDYGNIIKLLILTGARAEEIAGLQWGEIGNNAINLPGARTKNKRGHTIPLSEPAKAIIAAIGRGKRIRVFGRNDTGFYGWSKCKLRLDQKLGGEVAPWKIHDLRRSAVTGMAELGIRHTLLKRWSITSAAIRLALPASTIAQPTTKRSVTCRGQAERCAARSIALNATVGTGSNTRGECNVPK